MTRKQDEEARPSTFEDRPNTRPAVRRSAGLLLGAGVSLFFLWLALGDLHLAEVWAGIRRADYRWVVPGLTLYFLSVWVRSWRWAYLLRPAKRLSGNGLFSVMTIGYMGNDLFPFRLGELLRAYVLWRREGVNLGTTFTTALVERLFDGLTMVLFVFVGLLFVPLEAGLRRPATIGAAVFVGALLFFLWIAARPQLLRRWAEAVIGHLVPRRWRAPLLGLVEGIVTGLTVFRRPQDVLITFGYTLAVWLLETGKYYLVSMAFGMRLPFTVILLMAGAVNLLTALPALPGYVGVFETGIDILAWTGVDPTVAASYILVLHALLWFPVVALGLYFLFREGLSWRDVQALAAGEE